MATKAASGKTSTAKTSSSSSKAKTSSSSAKTTSAKANSTDLKLTATEKKLVELYRAADADTKKQAMNILKGEESKIGSEANKVMEKMLKTAVTQMIKNAAK